MLMVPTVKYSKYLEYANHIFIIIITTTNTIIIII